MPKTMEPASGRSRLPHAVLDEASRILKARKIVALLGEQRFSDARRILEIGCGSGAISSTLARIGHADAHVTAVDVADNRIVTDGYTFIKVDGTSLPFDAGSFDVIVTNHVIEHVGDRSEQLHHLREIARVMDASAITYLAVPNKWRLIEPHFRLPLLSWLPIQVADLYVRLMRRGDHYDCIPLSDAEARKLFQEAGLIYRELTIEAVRLTLLIEYPESRIARFLSSSLPSPLIKLAKPLISTLIYTLQKGSP